MDKYYKLKLFNELKRIQNNYNISKIYDINKIHLLDVSEFSKKDNELFKDFLNGSSKSKFKKSLKKDVEILEKNIKKNIKNNLSKDEEILIDILDEIGVFYFVGGCVRDSALGLVPKDFDLATEEDLEKIEFLIKDFKDIEFDYRGKQFEVLIVRLNKAEIEIARFREDIGTDGRRPKSVKVSDIFGDAQRRDFTINAGYVDIGTLELSDPNCQFVDDIKEKTLRFVGNPDERIKEDFLRGIRFYRFMNRGFNPDKKSLSAVRRNMDNILKNIDSNRFISEIEKILKRYDL